MPTQEADQVMEPEVEPEVESEEESEEDLSIDAGGLISAMAPKGVDIFGDDAPEVVRLYDDRDEDFSISQEELQELPPAAKHAVANFRRAFLRKTQEIAHKGKALLEQEAAIEQRILEIRNAENEVLQSRAAMFSILDNEDVRKAIEDAKTTEKPPDPWSEEYRDYQIKTSVAEAMEAMLSSVKARSEEESRLMEARKAEFARERRVAEIEAFRKEHPDFDTLRDDIVALRKRSGYTLTAEEAYDYVRAKRVADGRAVQDTAVRQARSETRAAVARPAGAGRRVNIEMPPSGLSGREIEAWWDERPEARAALLEKIRRG